VILESSDDLKIQILTPTDPEQRGAQLSLRILNVDSPQIFSELEKSGVCVSSSRK
jgi:kynureninase